MVTKRHQKARTAELEATLLAALATHYDMSNTRRFGGRLQRPVLALSDSTTQLGCWVGGHLRTLQVSRSLVLAHPWLEVIGVLEHEMAHQFVEDVLQVRDEPPHGPTFRSVCDARGIYPHAAGTPCAAAIRPDDAEESDLQLDRVMERVRKLLALAGSSNEHEAELAMRRAQALMLRHNIEAAAAKTTRAYEARQLGDPAKRRTFVERSIASLLSEYFFVQVIGMPVYVPRLGTVGTVYEIVGTRANVEMARHVYEYLLATADRLWRANAGDARVRGAKDRISYQAGVIAGFREKLRSERESLGATGLVWVGDRGLDEFFQRRYPITRTTRRTRRANPAHAAGQEAGRKVVIHRPIEQGPTAGRARPLPAG